MDVLSFLASRRIRSKQLIMLALLPNKLWMEIGVLHLAPHTRSVYFHHMVEAPPGAVKCSGPRLSFSTACWESAKARQAARCSSHDRRHGRQNGRDQKTG